MCNPRTAREDLPHNESPSNEYAEDISCGALASQSLAERGNDDYTVKTIQAFAKTTVYDATY